MQRKVQLSTWSLSALLFLYSCTKIVTTKPRIKAWHVDHVDVMKLPELTYFTEYFAGLLHCFLLRQLGNLGHLEEMVGTLHNLFIRKVFTLPIPRLRAANLNLTS